MTLVEHIIALRKENEELRSRPSITPENAQAYLDLAMQVNAIRDLLRDDHNLWVAMGPKLEALK